MKKEYYRVDYILRTGKIEVEITSSIGMLGSIYVGQTNGIDVVGTVVSKSAVELAKYKVIEYALGRERDKLKDQSEIVSMLEKAHKQMWP